MASSLCKITAAMAACIFLLALVLPPCSGQGSNGSGCTEVARSKTFQGDCHSYSGCAHACRGEGYTEGYCFTDIADPDHPVCMCASPCPPATTTRKTSS
ncbi:hypothetical protein ABZP36_022630 [Zizania latifolia]